MKKTLFALVILGAVFSLILGSYSSKASNNTTKKIALVIPMQHKAMDEITAGFLEEIKNAYGEHIKIDIENASGDKALLRAIMTKSKRAKYDVVVPIGTESTLIASNMFNSQAIVGLDISQDTVFKNNCTAVVEALIDPSIIFLKMLKPELKKITHIYSAADKNYVQAKQLDEQCKALNIKLQHIIVETCVDLYSVKERIDKDSDFIFISKDHVIASGTATIAQTAEKLKIPFITSDEGSVISGAAGAIGNSESDVGRLGAKMALRVLSGEKISDVTPRNIETFSIFINKAAAKKQGLNIEKLEEIANTMHCKIKFVGESKI